MRFRRPFRNLSRHSGLRLMAAGLLFAGLGLAVPRIPELAGHLGVRGTAFVQGLCFGFCLAVEFAGIPAAIYGRRDVM